MKGVRLAEDTTYGGLGPDGTMRYLHARNAGDTRPFCLSPTMFVLTGSLEQQSWWWILCRNNLGSTSSMVLIGESICGS